MKFGKLFQAAWAVMFLSMGSEATVAAEPIRVLIVDGRNNHAWQGTTVALRQILLQSGAFTVDVSTAPVRYPAAYPNRPGKANDAEIIEYEAAVKHWRSAERNYEASIDAHWEAWRPQFSQYDVVVDNYNGPDWRLPVKADLVEFVRAGGGLIVLHAANNCFSGWDDFNRMIGLGWRKHDQGIRITVDDATGQPIAQPSGTGPDSGHGSKHAFTVKTRANDYPIMRGLPTSWMHGCDELYHAMRGPAEGVQILASAWSAKDQRGTGDHEPLVWATRFGKGRVVTNTMGHYWPSGGQGYRNRHSLHCVGFQTVMARSCQWAATGDVTLDMPDSFPTAEAISIVHPELLQWSARGQTLPQAPQAIADAAARSSFKKQRNPYALLTPAESVASLELPAGYRAEIVLSEPHIREPVLAVWDGNGRMYVAEMRSYMQDEYGTGTKTLRNGLISRHEDTDGDGTLDRHTVFVDGLNLPRMLLPLDDRLAVIETDSTDIVTYRDTDGDGVADEKKMVHEGSRKIDASRSVEHQDSGLVWSIDNWVYLSRGRERYRFSGDGVEVGSIEFDWNQWGLDQDDTGRLFFNANSEPLKSFQQHPIYWRQISSKAGGRWQKPTIGSDYAPEFLNMHSTCELGDRGEDHAYRSFTSATGGSVFRGDAFPEDARGDYFICDPTGHLVRRASLDREAGKIQVRNAYEDQKSEFIVSDDINFRPVSTHTGPDGCLYVVDMYRGMIQDAPWVNDNMKAMLRNTGLNFNINQGRIYRIVHEDHSPNISPPLLDAELDDLVPRLADDNGWVRDTAQKLIVLRAGQISNELSNATIVGALNQMSLNHDSPVARLHALWTLDGIGATDARRLALAMTDSDWRVREAAIRIAEPLIAADEPIIWTAIEKLASDADPNVARQLILSLGWELSPRAIALIDRVIERHITNEVVYLSAMTALYDHPTPLIERMLSGQAFRRIRDPKQRINTQRRWTSGIAAWKQENATPPRPLDAEAIKLVEDGYHIYAQLCINCHGQDGQGVILPGLPAKAPPLARSDRVTSQKEVLARIVLHGLAGPVDGKTYHEVMAPSDKNDDRWIAAVTSYIRQDWGNVASIIRPNDVARIREASRSRYRPWTLTELQRYRLPVIADRTTWAVNCDGGPDAAARAINGKSDSCDNSNRPGRWFEVDLGVPHTITSMVLTSSTPDRYPREFEVVVSEDGQSWSDPIAVGKGEGGVNFISMEPTLGQIFRIIQTGSDDHHRWSIVDLQVHGIAGEQAALATDEDDGPLPPAEELLKLSGDAIAGAAVFGRTCSQCHKVDGTGIDFGPDLSKLSTTRKPAEILHSILQPNETIDPKYQGEMVITVDGQIFSGFVTAETDQTLTIRTANNKVSEVPQDDIDERRKLKTSFMPTGLQRTMRRQEFVDLLEYLKARK